MWIEHRWNDTPVGVEEIAPEGARCEGQLATCFVPQSGISLDDVARSHQARDAQGRRYALSCATITSCGSLSIVVGILRRV
jgi:hypothetical protein